MSIVEEFTSNWNKAMHANAIARGVPERFLVDVWSFDNLCPTQEGTFAFLSYGDGKTILAEFTLGQIEEAIFPANIEDIAQALTAHQEYVSSVENLVMNKGFTLKKVGKAVSILRWGGYDNLLLAGEAGALLLADYSLLDRWVLSEVGYPVAKSTGASLKDIAPIREAFFAAHLVSPERQLELQKEFEEKGWIKPAT